jgi:hypothetical protein
MGKVSVVKKKIPLALAKIELDFALGLEFYASDD